MRAASLFPTDSSLSGLAAQPESMTHKTKTAVLMPSSTNTKSNLNLTYGPRDRPMSILNKTDERDRQFLVDHKPRTRGLAREKQINWKLKDQASLDEKSSGRGKIVSLSRARSHRIT
jgi:hypothetical protein